MGKRMTEAVRKVRRGGQPRWVIDFSYIDKAGVTHRYRRDARVQSAEGARREARQRQELAQLHGSPEGRPAAVGFRTFVEGTFATEHMPRFRPSTQRRYLDLLRQRLLEHFGDQSLDAVDGASLQSLAGKLARAGVQAKGAMLLTRTILRAAVESGVIAVAPKVPRCWSEGRRVPQAPTDIEVDTLVAGARGWLRVAIGLGAYAGLRNGEVRALEVRDVDLVHQRLVVRRSFSDDQITAPKSGHDRVVPIAGPLLPILQTVVANKDPRARVVLNGKGRTPGRQALLTALTNLEARLGIQHRSFHELRHFFLSALVRRGASVEAVRLLAGHADLKVTQLYVHAQGHELRAAVDLLSGDGR